MDKTIDDSNWIDIIPPQYSQADVLATSSIVWMILIGFIGAAMIVYYFSPKTKAIRTLKNLLKSVKKQSDTKRIAHFVFQTISRYLTHANVSILEHTNNQQWHSFIAELRQLQYQAEPPRPAEIKIILTDAIYWLKNVRKLHEQL